MPSGAVEANTTPPAASRTAARAAATSAYRPPAAGWRTKFGWMASSAPITAMVMAPSIMADTRNSTRETPSTEAGMRTPEINNSASASKALMATESAPPAKMAARRARERPHKRYGRQPASTPTIATLITWAPNYRHGDRALHPRRHQHE